MQVSLNEIQRLCQKAAEGAGVPAGLDTEVAQATSWLLAHGFSVLNDLATTLENLSGQSYRFSAAELHSDTLNASTKAGPLIIPGLVDLLIARSPAKLTVHNLDSPCYLLPAALRYATQGWCLSFELSLPAGQRFVVNTNSAGPVILGLEKNGPAVLLSSNTLLRTERVNAVGVASDYGIADRAGFSVSLDQSTLAIANARSHANGVQMDSCSWQRLHALALKVLVPSSASSRQGAGALRSDTE